ncbi:MAG: diaminopimelate epimerase [Rhodospirillales bacterium]|jgi:diaminopimelate epimerase|nr:diaminopimelate epimerase [Rhodospirillales bacterium]
MHGLGNDFVVLDGRREPLSLDSSTIRSLGDRHTGIGFDQLALLEHPRDGGHVRVRFYNQDGGEVATCGNASRCVGRLLLDETGERAVTLETGGGPVVATDAGEGLVTIDMGRPRFGWREIPLARDVDTRALPLGVRGLPPAFGVSIGNPHAVFIVDDAGRIDVAHLGAQLEHDPLFPERANIEFAQILSKDRVRMRVWERGAGITLACGSGACATLIATASRGLTGRRAAIVLDGGELTIEWTAQDRVLLTGPVATAFTGIVELPDAAAARAA